MQVGTQVVRISSGEAGVLLRLRGEMAEVVFPSGRMLLAVEDLEPADGEPDEQLAAGVLHDSEAFRLRFLAQYLRYAFRYDPLAGLTNARIEPLPHQISVAHRVMNKFRPRMILADEVGLGKTIEAGLIIKESLARGSASRVLVVCPASLQYQWQFELESKFNEEFEILDSQALKFLSRDGTNPWTRVDKVITSLHLARRRERIEEIIDAGWDLVVFDEAHRVRRRRDLGGSIVTTKAYELADELKDHSPGVLLLTATPMQLHPYEFFSLIELVEPGLFGSFSDYDRQRTEMPALNEFAKAIIDWDGLASDERRSIIDTFSDVLERIGIDPSNAEQALDEQWEREEAIRSLIEIHPLSSVMVRNRKAHLGMEARRNASRVSVIPRQDEVDIRDRLIDYVQHVHDSAIPEKQKATGFLLVVYRKMLASSSHALVMSLKGRLEKLRGWQKLGATTIREPGAEVVVDSTLDGDFSELETVGIDPALLKWEIDHLQDLIDDAAEVHDSKLEALAYDIVQEVLSADPDEKILIFTGFRKTQDLIATTLRSMGYRVAIFNGSLNLDQKEAAVRDFRERAQILVSTEAGGEGRNFQFAHIMVNYDLPWNPMVVEQRIGRLDRIGQDKQVQIYNLALEGTIEEKVLDVLEDRIKLFEESIGSLDPILGEVERDIERLVIENREAAQGDIVQLGVSLEQRVKQARLSEHQLSDFILDAASFRKDEANQLMEREPMASWSDLRHFTSTALEHLGGSLSRHDAGGDAVALSPDLASELRMNRLTLRGAFNPADALAMEEVDFFAFGHEFVDRLILLAAESDAVTGAYLDRDGGPAELVELVYNIEWDGARPGGKLIRHRIDDELHVDASDFVLSPSVDPVRGVNVPEWTEDAIRTSRQILERDQEPIHRAATEENETAKIQLLERRRRVYSYQQATMEEKISIQQERVDNADTSKEGVKRVLPAWKGRLEALRNRMRTLDSDLERDIAAIEATTVGLTIRVVSAAVVVGE